MDPYYARKTPRGKAEISCELGFPISAYPLSAQSACCPSPGRICLFWQLWGVIHNLIDLLSVSPLLGFLWECLDPCERSKFQGIRREMEEH